MIQGVERGEPGSTPTICSIDFYIQIQPCVPTLVDGVPLIPLLACKRTLSLCEGAGDGLG